MLAIPIINPMRIPIPISDPPRDLYNFIEDNVNPGDNVLMWAGFELNTWETEYQPASLAVISHLLLEGADVYIICDGTETPPLAATLFDDPNMKKGDAVYGENYVLFGYYAGGEVALSRFAEDVRGLVAADFYGTPIGQIPMMDGIETAEDFDLVFHNTGAPPELIVRQYVTRYGLPTALIYPQGGYVSAMNYYEAGQLVGFVAGTRGAAEYEALTNNPGIASANTAAVSFGMMWFALMIVLSNLFNYMARRRSPV
jgi:hypothetical protein